MGRWKAAVLVVAAGVGIAGCRRPAPPDGRPPGAIVDVIAREWAFEPSPLQVRAGRVTFHIRNEGGVEHNFVIENAPGADVEAIRSGEAKQLTVDLTPGDYTAICNIPGHREAGMVTTIKVTP
ncbi:MAG: cupredoxin domain-containing protein [Armatimonadetes bacterium]|nr:cupredoxin domain-containing protein [Armatimonadota bacterium]